jgi:hypothetical protein
VIPGWLKFVLAVMAVAILVLLYMVFIRGTGTAADGDLSQRVDRLYTYLGSNNPPDKPDQWSGLIGNLGNHAVDVRRVLSELECRVTKLEGKKCGPPGTVPRDPPTGP